MKQALLLSLSICAAPAVSALTLYTENNAPFNFVDKTSGKVVGMSVDIVRKAAARANVPVSIDLVPWARALEMARQPSESDICVFSVTRTPEREPSYQWIGPLAYASWALFARGDFNGRLDNLDDAKKYVIGGYLYDSRTNYVKSLGGFKLDIVGNDMLNPKKLALGRIDLWLSDLHGGRKMAHGAGVDGIKPVLVFREVGNYLACAPKVPAATVSALRQALEQMRQDGTVARITARTLKNYR